MGSLLIPEFWGTGNYPEHGRVPDTHQEKEEKLCGEIFSLSLFPSCKTEREEFAKGQNGVCFSAAS